MSDRGSISGNEGKGRLQSEEGAETPPFFIYRVLRYKGGAMSKPFLSYIV